MDKKIKIVYFATPDIALESFDFFIKSSDYDVLALVSQKPKAQGRGKKLIEHNIVKLARKNSIEVFEPEKISKDEELIKKLKNIEPDFFVTFAFGQILSQEVIDIPKFATINLHASLLPQYRGANPISSAIIDGCKKTGITTMKTSLELDAGDICLQKEIEISDNMNVVELMDKVSSLSPELLDKTLKGLYEGTLKACPQEACKATFTKKLKKEQKLIDWSSCACDLHNKIRGMYQINTNHTFCNGKIVKVLETKVCDKDYNCQASRQFQCCEIIDITKDAIVVACSDGALEIISVKPEGKGKMRAVDWARGARIKKGDRFGDF